ncbi:MAG: FeS assembly SUF system protein [Bacteroidetes bacterium CG2_30_32_10]|nr:MAG: FeS assembly SUF system protein [Bacteroidetes bacterium CG2_30_32_10]
MENQNNYLALESKIVDTLKTIFDPEIPVNIYDLGLIYEIKVDENKKAYIKMTLTSPNCPIAETMPTEVRDAVKLIEGISDVEIDLTFEPPWDKDMISEAAMLELGLL